MPDMLAIVSKAVFEKDAPKAKLGDVLPWKVYRSASPHLESLGRDSRLFLIAVRPPDESLWLVAVLSALDFDGDIWRGARNRHAITDIGALRDKLRFQSGKGIQAKKGALGMSLQTPRVLTAEDSALLLQAAGEPQDNERPRRPRLPGPVNLALHDDKGPLPCLCRDCLPAAPERLDKDGAGFFRTKVDLHDRVLWFWVPDQLVGEVPEIIHSVQSRLFRRVRPPAKKE